MWIATISAFVLIEKIVPVGRLISRIAGAGFVAAGALLVVGSSRIGFRCDNVGGTV
jgi:predicted metal-binding membrane protein